MKDISDLKLDNNFRNVKMLRKTKSQSKTYVVRLFCFAILLDVNIGNIDHCLSQLCPAQPHIASEPVLPKLVTL